MHLARYEQHPWRCAERSYACHGVDRVTSTVSSARCLTSAVLSAVFSGHVSAILSAVLTGLVSVCRLTSAVLSGVMFGSCLASRTACYGEHLLRCAERTYVATASTVLRRPSRRLCTFTTECISACQRWCRPSYRAPAFGTPGQTIYVWDEISPAPQIQKRRKVVRKYIAPAFCG